jgi:hypothetical protein
MVGREWLSLGNLTLPWYNEVIFGTAALGCRGAGNMRLALISDVHANLEALEAVLQSVAQEEVDLILHLGDLVGYNANPRECGYLVQRPINRST